MVQKIYARSVMRMGRESQHSFMVTIPKKICNVLQIEKGTKLYIKLEEKRFVVSKDSKFLHNKIEDTSCDTTIVESVNHPTKKEKEDVIVHGISLDDLQY